ncbi:MAG: DUF29 domain-containing protein [Acaryochloridaceae cyanobacterium RL_2_7]|nr:DUF29 domain-containing protein [Acaryochloridaceae cyanobacterium RL_2_7]
MDVPYETDIVAWADEQSQLLRSMQWDALDINNIAEEIADLGRKYRDALKSQMNRLLMHRLKQQFQPLLATRSWDLSIREATKQIRRLLRDHPSLKNTLQESITICYQDAREDAADETGLTLNTFPDRCPTDLEEELLNLL